MCTGCLVFITIDTSCEHRESQILFGEFTICSLQIFFSYEKNQIMFDWRGSLTLYKRFAVRFFPLSFMVYDKNWLFLFKFEKYRMFLCTTCQKKKIQSLPCLGYGFHWLAWTAVNLSLDLSNKFGRSFLIRAQRVRLLSCHTFVITIGYIEIFSNPLHWASNAKQYIIGFQLWGGD